MESGKSLLNLFDGLNRMDSYAVVSNGDPSLRQFDINFYMPFNQWELTQFGYWEGIFTDNNQYISSISLIPPNKSKNYAEVFNVPRYRNTLYSFSRSDSFDSGDSNKNRFILGLETVTAKEWHAYTEIIFELRIPYTEYKAWKRQYHVPVKIAKKTIGDKTIGTIVMKGNS